MNDLNAAVSAFQAFSFRACVVVHEARAYENDRGVKQ